MKKAAFVIASMLTAITIHPVQGQIRVEPVVGVLFANHMPSRTLSQGDMFVSVSEAQRDAAAMLGLRVEVPVNARLAMAGSYRTARTTLTRPSAGGGGETSQVDLRVNIMSTQAIYRVTSPKARGVLALSAGPARVATGSGLFDIDGTWAASGGVTAGYRIGGAVSLLARQEIFTYDRLEKREYEHAFSLGVGITPWGR